MSTEHLFSSQMAGCEPKGLLATCLIENTCPQAMLDKVGTSETL